MSTKKDITNVSHNKTKKVFKSKKIEKVIVEKLLSDEEIEKREGDFFSRKDFKRILKRDCDVYYLQNGKEILLGKFRKNVLPREEILLAIENLKESSKREHDNRGSAAGKLDLKKLPIWIDPERVKNKQKFIIGGYYSKKTGKYIKQKVGNVSKSNIIGYYDKPDRNLGENAPPCRQTQFNKLHPDKFESVIPLIRSIDKQFKKLVPLKHKKQYKRAKKTNFVIDDTAFSTITINNNWRTALHKDSGDLKEGFGNLVVCEEGKYKGGYTGFPQFGIAFDVRQGDFLAMDVHEWHCNTDIKGKRKRNEKGELENDFLRLSLVCYLREKMLRCKGLKV